MTIEAPGNPPLRGQISNHELLRTRIIAFLRCLADGEYKDAHEIFNAPSVYEVADSSDRVSMRLSDMHRAGYLTRIPCTKRGTNLKYSYALSKAGYTPVVRKAQVPASTAGTVVPEATPVTGVVVAAPVASLPEPALAESDGKPEITVSETRIVVVSKKYKLTIEF